jgi:hypothetical protein
MYKKKYFEKKDHDEIKDTSLRKIMGKSLRKIKPKEEHKILLYNKRKKAKKFVGKLAKKSVQSKWFNQRYEEN